MPTSVRFRAGDVTLQQGTRGLSPASSRSSSGIDKTIRVSPPVVNLHNAGIEFPTPGKG